MALLDHYAVLLAINYYPGLRSLKGPENDIDAFKGWLASPVGGNLDPRNIKVIRSSDYQPPATDPNDANPTERALIKVLDQWVRIGSTRWQDRVGTRLYLYMAGHGFTAGASVNDPALFSAVAQNGDTAHIAGYRYASKLANAGFFDEIVLVMDCCQDVLKASQVLDPTWSPPDRDQSGRVKLLQAYGAPRGEAAFESEEAPGMTRGYFSRVLLQALNAALPDVGGYVTGTTLKQQFQEIWSLRFKAITGYDPPIITPAGQDIRLFQRPPASPAATNGSSVLFSLTSPAPPGAVIKVTHRPTSPVLSLDPTQLAPQSLLPGIYKAVLEGTSRVALFEITAAGETRVDL